MKQMSTGFGLAVLGFGIATLGLSNLAGSRGNQAQAQTGSGRSIVSANVLLQGSTCLAYRIWNDNTIELRPLGTISINSKQCGWNGRPQYYYSWSRPDSQWPTDPAEGCPTQPGDFWDGSWRTVDNGLTTFVPADVDANQSVDAADLGSVLSHYGETQEGNPPPPIDCTINAPR
jgi:hypothetical protein